MAALTVALSAASAFAPCRGREFGHAHAVGPPRPRTAAAAAQQAQHYFNAGRDEFSGAIWGRRLPGAARAASASVSARGASLDGFPEKTGGGGARKRERLSALFRRGGDDDDVDAPAPPLAGDAPSSLREDEMNACADRVRSERGAAGVEEVRSICFDPRSIDGAPVEPDVVVEGASTLPGGVEVRGGGGGLDDDELDDGVDGDEEVETEAGSESEPEGDDEEEEEAEDDDDSTLRVPAFDDPVTPSYELPEPFHSTVNGDGEVNEEHDHRDGNNERDRRNNDGDDDAEEAAPEPRALNGRGLVLVDAFSPFHGQYLSKMAREAYGAGVVSVLSAYVTGYLYQERGMTEHLSMRLPKDYAEVEKWVNALPFELVGIICESDSGLDDAERFGEALGLYPDRHDGYNAGRRDKFLMNEACRRHGLRVVEQRLCEDEEEALEFAAEMGICDGVNGDVMVGRGDGNDEALLEELAERVVEKSGDAAAEGLVRAADGDAERGDAGDGETAPDEEAAAEVATMEDLHDDLDVTEELCRHDEGDEDEATRSGDVEVNGDANGAAAAATEQNQGQVDEPPPQDDDDDEDEYHSNPGKLGLAAPPSSKNYVVVKPTRGVASDSVHLCPSLDSVSKAFHSIHGTSVFGATKGETHSAVLVQQFARGTEYAVDIVSRAGHHKVAALWRYDKRPANGAPFVYHATELVDADTDVGRMVCRYAMESLDALDVHWGMSHTEVIVDDSSSDDDDDDDNNDDGDGGTGELTCRLVEVNCRQHNTDFAPLTTACIGYNALDMLLAAYLGDADEYPPETEHKRLPWDDLPDLPVTRSYGAIVHLVSHAGGTLRGVNAEALGEVESMKGVVAMEVYPQCSAVGGTIRKTIDIRTDAGWCHLMGDDGDDFKRQYDRIVELMPRLFDVEEEDGPEAEPKVEGGGGDQGAADAHSPTEEANENDQE